MIRTFNRHNIRKVVEISDKLWNMEVTQGDFKGKNYSVLVPSCWESIPELSNYRGTATYTTQFAIEDNSKNKAIRLVFKGVSHTGNVYIDDKFVGTHYNAFTPFEIIVKGLNAGTHTLKVEVDNSFSEESVLHKENDYMTYGGITRAVGLEFINDIYIKQIHFSPYKKDDCWFGKVEIEVENISDESKNCQLSFTLNNKQYKLNNVVQANCTEKIVSDYKFDDVEQWMMETPNLYLLDVVLSVDGHNVDDLIERVGFREVKLDGTRILINGKKIRIKGFNRHEDHPHFGCAIPYSAMVYDLQIIKDVGANSIRTCHYPNDEIFLDLCDEMGILVWEEHHARGFDEDWMRKANFESQCYNCNQEMVNNHYNHPSIYIWGILNECASDTEFGAECYKKQFEQIRSLDSTRPTTFASNKKDRDLAFEYPTVISNNLYPLWYFDTPVKESLDIRVEYMDKMVGKKPYLVSEIGAGGIYGCRNTHYNKAKWTEEYQDEVVTEQVQTVLDYERCSGVYIWQFCDVRVTEEWAMKRPRSMNNKGIVDEYRREKQVYYSVKRIFNSYSNYFDN